MWTVKRAGKQGIWFTIRDWDTEHVLRAIRENFKREQKASRFKVQPSSLSKATVYIDDPDKTIATLEWDSNK